MDALLPACRLSLVQRMQRRPTPPVRVRVTQIINGLLQNKHNHTSAPSAHHHNLLLCPLKKLPANHRATLRIRLSVTRGLAGWPTTLASSLSSYSPLPCTPNNNV